jgi:hypothetical protein
MKNVTTFSCLVIVPNAAIPVYFERSVGFLPEG